MNCWTCDYQKIGGFLTFLGLCRWFTKRGQPEKPIPAEVVDRGCKFWAVRQARKDPEDAGD